MADQEKKELDYLQHIILNGTAVILGCLKEIEERISVMASAVKSFRQKWETNKHDED